MPSLSSVRRACRARLLKIAAMFVGFLRVLSVIEVGTPGHITASWHRRRTAVAQLVNNMVAHEFTRSFRMTYVNVEALFKTVVDALYRDPAKALNSC